MLIRTSLVTAVISIILLGWAVLGQAAVPPFVDYHTATAELTWRYLDGS